ncbi:hypothetical protein [Chryseosolibacter indicus]|uniref:Oxygen tolerance n=1 Tax=Chryseosolibacter indicus TaxID=2782351 RepID=A0ABS5VNV5_9BACT|nr:hypothetical protein [Chryseosolibacter indicus]MBT1702454.1 hypothetical protein [Chryseosolibacter indicus]
MNNTKGLIPSFTFGFIFLLILVQIETHAQNIKVSGGFLSDSLKVGEQTAFYLTSKHPSNINVLFPDSAYKFNTFEYQKRRYFATETTDSISVDSVVYYLTTFELDESQALQLPVYVVNEQDCTSYLSQADTIRLTLLVKNVPDSLSIDKLPLRETTAYVDVGYQFNYIILLIVVVVLIILAIIVWIIFGKRISRYFKAKRLQRNHNQFIEAYTRIVNQLTTTFSASHAETALTLWKRYMEQLEARPYTKLTTRETILLQNDSVLGQNLQLIDRAIYGHNTSVIDPLEQLRKVADDHFRIKIKEVKDGK